MHTGNRPSARGPETESRWLCLRGWLWAAAALLWLWLLPQLALAQGPSLSLQLRRERGYGADGAIHGRFRIMAQGPADLERVTFWMDAQVVHELRQPPWAWSFHTDAFDEGMHRLRATGWTRSGLELPSETIQVRFFSAADAVRAALRQAMVLLSGVGIVLVISGTMTLWLSRGPKSGAPNHARPWWSRVGRPTSPPVASKRLRRDAERAAFGHHSHPEGKARLRWDLQQSRYVDGWPLPASQSAQSGFDKNWVLCNTQELKGDDGNE